MYRKSILFQIDERKKMEVIWNWDLEVKLTKL